MPTTAISYNDPGVRQDLWGSIKDLDAVNTYVITNAQTVPVSNKVHSWISDNIAVQTAQGGTVEGADTTFSNTDPVTLTNNTQIMEFGFKVSATDENSNHPAFASRFAREQMKNMKIWKNQFELSAVTGVVGAGGGTGAVSAINVLAGGNYSVVPTTVVFSAPPTGGTTALGTVVTSGSGSSFQVTGVIVTNPGSGYVSAPSITISGGTPVTAPVLTALINGSARTMNGVRNFAVSNVTNAGAVSLTSTLLNGYLGSAWVIGSELDTILVNQALKQKISSFTVGNTRNVDAAAAELVGRVDVYDSDFGRMEVVKHRYVAATEIIGYISDYVATGNLDAPHYEDRPRAGYYKAGAIVGESTVQVANERAVMLVTNLLTT